MWVLRLAGLCRRTARSVLIAVFVCKITHAFSQSNPFQAIDTLRMINVSSLALTDIAIFNLHSTTDWHLCEWRLPCAS